MNLEAQKGNSLHLQAHFPAGKVLTVPGEQELLVSLTDFAPGQFSVCSSLSTAWHLVLPEIWAFMRIFGWAMRALLCPCSSESPSDNE